MSNRMRPGSYGLAGTHSPRSSNLWFAPICPDFVIELWSPSDILNEIQFKLGEYVANGAKPGFLIYPPQRNVIEPATSHNVWTILDPCWVIPQLPGFTLDLTESGNNATYRLLK